MNQASNISSDLAIVLTPKFVDPIPALYAPLKGYVPAVLSLMLRHAYQQVAKKQMSAAEALLSCGWIGRLITLDKRVLSAGTEDEIKGWSPLRDRIVKALIESNTEMEFDAISDQLIKDINPVLHARFIEDYRFPERAFHCWWYTIHDDNKHLALHLVNAYQPHSPFDNLDHFLRKMLEAIEHALAKYPDIQIVSCGSWLNQLPKFQQLWPAVFLNNQRILNETGGFGPGAWGQYMSTSGGFNEWRAATLLKTGKHPYPLTESHAPVNEVVIHVKKLIS